MRGHADLGHVVSERLGRTMRDDAQLRIHRKIFLAVNEGMREINKVHKLEGWSLRKARFTTFCSGSPRNARAPSSAVLR